MKKTLLLVSAVIMMVLSFAQNSWGKCLTVVNVPATMCVGDKYDLSINDAPCDCIKYSAVEWVITDPSGTTTVVFGSPLSYVFSMVGTYKVCVKWSDICTGEGFFECHDVVVSDCKCKPKIDIPATICAGTKYNLSINDDPCDCIHYDEVEWVITDPGGLTTTTFGSPLSYTFSIVGTYTVCLKWHDYCTGITHFECHDVIVKDCCKAKVDIPISICAGEKYNLSVNDDPCDCIKYDAVEWIITDPGGVTNTYFGSPLSYTFSTVGTYKVCVKWHDDCTGADFFECHDVIVKNCCTTKVDIPTTICAGGKYNLSISDAPCDCINYADVKWVITDPGGVVTSFPGSPLSYVFAIPGTYKVCVYWHDNCTGKDNFVCQDVIVTDCCKTKVDVPSTLCVGTKYTMSVNDDPCDCIKYTEVEWIITDPGGTTTTYFGSPLTYTFSMVGTYKVCIKWFDYCLNKTFFECYDVVIKDCCKPVIDIPKTLCVGTTYNLSIKDGCDCIDYTTVKWVITDPGGIVTSYAGTPLSYLFSIVGTYKVCVYWHDNCTGKDNSYCQDVVVIKCCTPVINIPTTLCVGTKYFMSIKDDCDCIDYTTVKWVITDPGGISTIFTGDPLGYIFSIVGTYHVCVYWHDHCTGKDNSYCQDVIVKDCCKPVFDIPTNWCLGTKYTLSIKDDCGCIDYTTVKWVITDPGGISTTYTGTPLTYLFSMVGTYHVCVYWHDKCTGKDNSYCQDVIVKNCCKAIIDIPTKLCVATTYNLSIKDDCGCIDYHSVKWVITDPGGISTSYAGTPLTYVFSMIGTYTVCVYWHDNCTGKDNSYCQNVSIIDCCKPVIDIPTVKICAGTTYNLSIKDICDCIDYTSVKWVITDPGGITNSYPGDPLSYVFSMVGTYHVCVYWHDHCTGKDNVYCQDVVVINCCTTKTDIPATICAGTKYNLSISDAPCDCIDYTKVKWVITDPGGITNSYPGSPLSYVFTTVGTYHICVYWHDNCTGKDGSYCQDVVVTNCSCICDMKIYNNTSTTDFGGGVIIGSFHLNSGSKKVVGVDISVPFWNYDWKASGCKFNCDELNTGYPLGNIIKYTDFNGYYPTHAGCFDEWWAREMDWTFPSPQYIDQDFTYVISIPHTDCKMDYYYCVKVLLHYDDCTVCECTFCFKGDEIVCSCDPAGSAAGKGAKAVDLTPDNVNVYPNPNDGSFTVQMQPTNSTKVISVMDMTGKTVLKSVVSGEKANVELKDVASGTYMVVITSDGKSVSKRVVINSK